MKKAELQENIKVWCWWKSRYLYYTGRVINGKYKFVDVCDAITMIEEKSLEGLEIIRRTTK
jgi:hypothetical protein